MYNCIFLINKIQLIWFNDLLSLKAFYANLAKNAPKKIRGILSNESWLKF